MFKHTCCLGALVLGVALPAATTDVDGPDDCLSGIESEPDGKKISPAARSPPIASRRHPG